MHHSARWIVKYDECGYLIREVKLIYNPDEYRKFKNVRRLNTQNGLIKILEKDKLKR
tara:strand:+ start:5472 stop:5642 length:171 start_codon:yes stop_codon:yes gene_type:complete